MTKTIINFSLLVILLISINVSAQERFVRPVDEAKNDQSFESFRTKLIEAVKKRDKQFLINVTDKNIKIGFGGNDGIEEFKKTWKINSLSSKLWNELLVVLSNGGTFSDKNTFAAPYTFNAFPEDLDVFEHQIIFGNNVNLRAKPDKSAAVISQLSYNIVKVDYKNSVSDGRKEETYLWYKVETLGGKKGFVSAEFVRSPVDYRAIFEKKNNKWRMTVFLAGD